MLFMGLTEYANKAYELEQSTVHVLQNLSLIHIYEPVVGFNARCGAGVLVLLSVCRLYILAANGSGTNAFTLRGCGIRDTYIAVSYTHLDVYKRQGRWRAHGRRRR